MRRLGTFVLMLLGLVVLLVGCGGGEDDGENVVLAVAFRLDEGTPLMAAYVGDPAKDPFELPAGRYYVEALNEDEMGIWVGTVDVREGDAVGFPESFPGVSGIADAAGAEPLLTVASFLLDVEMARVTFLEVVTGGFAEVPFDPAVQLRTTDFSEVFQMLGDIAEGGEAVLQAITDIEGRAQVSLGVVYVRSAGMPGLGLFDLARQATREFIDVALGVRDAHRQRMVELAQSIDEKYRSRALASMPSDLKNVGGQEVPTFEEWLDLLERGQLDRRLGDIDVFLDGFALEIGLAAIEESNFGSFGDQDLAALYEIHPWPDGPFLSAVYRHIDDIDTATLRERREEWVTYASGLAASFGEVDPAEARERLRDRIRANMEGLLPPQRRGTSDQWTEVLVSSVLREVPELMPLADTGVQTPVVTPSAGDGEHPADEGEEVTAAGQFLSYAVPVGPASKIEENRVSLSFSRSGGTVTGEGVVNGSNVGQTCPPGPFSMMTHLEGTYDPESRRFEGTWRGDMTLKYYVGDCDNPETVTESGEGQWEATLEDGVVRGSMPVPGPNPTVMEFQLAVQE